MLHQFIILIKTNNDTRTEEMQNATEFIYIRFLSRCNLILYAFDTKFQESIYLSMHIAIHFCRIKKIY